MKTQNRNPQSSKKPKLRLFIGCIFIIFFTLAAGGFIAYSWYQNAVYSPASNTEEALIIEVTEGESLFTIAEELQSKSALTSVDALKIYLRLNPGVDTSIQAGTYTIAKNLNIPELLARLVKGPSVQVIKVTIIEGWRKDEVANAIANAYTKATISPNLSAEFSKEQYLNIVNNPDKYKFSEKVAKFLAKHKPANKPLEGFLFPDTYNIATDATELDIINLQISTLIDRINQANLDIDNFDRLKSFYDVVTMTSIVQKEGKGLENKKLISDIFMRRLENNWVLNSDATIFYSLNRWQPGLTDAELKRDTPYNSYTRQGLPPTPVCNPGIEAFRAVYEYTPNQYFYFITDADGIYRYARTLSEHSANIAKYGVLL